MTRLPLGLLALCALCALFAGDESSAASPPNIIVFLADDMGLGDTSAYQDFTGTADDVQLHTPNLERLARRGVRFTDAHAPASRCSPTRYALLTGRYAWRNRLKWWVLFGSQGDPMIEADRPTLASLLRSNGYSTGMVGKWHLGLRYQQPDGMPAAGWKHADLTNPLHTTPLDHGFNFARFTSRSHGTSGPTNPRKNGPRQSVGPGHVHGRTAVGATGNGKELVSSGPDAYVLSKLGRRHSDHALEFLASHLDRETTKKQPFFLYYASNSNHAPYTPSPSIGGEPVAGAARTKSGAPMDARHDLIYENDVALGRLLDWLETTKDPRDHGSMLIDNTLVIFTSDNGAEKDIDSATGPFRGHKGSCYEGGHRVALLASWPAGGVGDGDPASPGRSDATPIGLQDLYATFAEIVGGPLPDPVAGGKGAEDSFSILPALRGKPLPRRPPLFFHDHKEAEQDAAVLAMRLDSPRVEGSVREGQWKIFFRADLIRQGQAEPFELYNLAADPRETTNLIAEPALAPLVDHLTATAFLHRNAGGHRLADPAPAGRIVLDWRSGADLGARFDGKPAARLSVPVESADLTLTIESETPAGATFSPNPRGLGLSSGDFQQVDSGEAFLIRFDRDVLVESAAIVAGNGRCGGFYRVGKSAPLAIYCVDADNDARTQHGVLSDIGVLQAGETLRLDSGPHLGVEPPGQWRLGALTIRPFPTRGNEP